MVLSLVKVWIEMSCRWPVFRPVIKSAPFVFYSLIVRADEPVEIVKGNK